MCRYFPTICPFWHKFVKIRQHAKLDTVFRATLIFCKQLFKGVANLQRS